MNTPQTEAQMVAALERSLVLYVKAGTIVRNACLGVLDAFNLDDKSMFTQAQRDALARLERLVR